MQEQRRAYIAIDLKSMYASVECVARGLDPLDTNLVVADVSRTEKTICLAVTPSLKAYGIGGRARLFEVVKRLLFYLIPYFFGSILTTRSYDALICSFTKSSSNRFRYSSLQFFLFIWMAGPTPSYRSRKSIATSGSIFTAT